MQDGETPLIKLSPVKSMLVPDHNMPDAIRYTDEKGDLFLNDPEQLPTTQSKVRALNSVNNSGNNNE